MPILDNFGDYTPGLNCPVQGGFDITPTDGVDLVQVTRAVMVGSVGDLAVTLKDGSVLTLTGMTPGVIYPLRVVRVAATGTSAAGIKGLI